MVTGVATLVVNIITYREVESLLCPPETNVTPCVSCTQIKKKKSKEEKSPAHVKGKKVTQRKMHIVLQCFM